MAHAICPIVSILHHVVYFSDKWASADTLWLAISTFYLDFFIRLDFNSFSLMNRLIQVICFLFIVLPVIDLLSLCSLFFQEAFCNYTIKKATCKILLLRKNGEIYNGNTVQSTSSQVNNFFLFLSVSSNFFLQVYGFSSANFVLSCSLIQMLSWLSIGIRVCVGIGKSRLITRSPHIIHGDIVITLNLGSSSKD